MKKLILLSLSMFLISACLAFGKTAPEVAKSPLVKIDNKIVKSDVITISTIDVAQNACDISPGLPEIVGINNRSSFKVSAKFIIRYTIKPISKYRKLRQKGVYLSNISNKNLTSMHSRTKLPDKNI